MTTVLEFDAAFEPLLQAQGLTTFDAVFNGRTSAEATSKHAHRETAPVQLGAVGRFFLKRVSKVPLRHALFPLLAGKRPVSQPRHEWNVLGQLQDAGILAMRRAAFGEKRLLGCPRRAFLLVEAVPFDSTLEDWLVPGFPKPARLSIAQRHRLLYEIGRLVRTIHNADFRWPDMQAKHIFASQVRDAHAQSIERRHCDDWRFCLIDVERMQKVDALGIQCSPDGGGPDDELAFDNIRALFRSLRPLALSAIDIRCFWAGYCYYLRGVLRLSKPYSETKMARVIELEPRPRLPDDFEHPRAYPKDRRGRLSFDRRAVDLLKSLKLDTMPAVFAYQASESLTKPGLGPHRDRLRIPIAAGPLKAGALYLKRYRTAPWSERLRNLRQSALGRSAGAIETRFARKLAEIGIAAPRMIASGQTMRWPFETCSFSITAEVPGTSLEKLAASKDVRIDFAQWRDLIHQLALVVGALHRAGLFHRDLYFSHVFLARRADGQIVLHLIDLARMIEKPLRPRRWAIKDLAALAYSAEAAPVTRVDRLRFLYYYLRVCDGRVSETRLRFLTKRIDARVERTRRHDARRTHRQGTRLEDRPGHRAV